MTHQEAQNELSVERYLLGELSGNARDRFEDHLFDCTECASDVKEGMLFLEAAAPEWRQSESWAAQRKPRRVLAWPWQGWVLGPALAACLGVIVYQSTVVLPGMRAQLAESQTPVVLNPLVLANAGARGDSLAEIVSPRHGFYLLSVDIPPSPGASAYRCSLYSPTGELVWHVDVSPQQARDSVTIEVPVSTAQEGTNELRVQAVIASQSGDDKLAKLDKLVDLTKYRYQLKFAK